MIFIGGEFGGVASWQTVCCDGLSSCPCRRPACVFCARVPRRRNVIVRCRPGVLGVNKRATRGTDEGMTPPFSPGPRHVQPLPCPCRLRGRDGERKLLAAGIALWRQERWQWPSASEALLSRRTRRREGGSAARVTDEESASASGRGRRDCSGLTSSSAKHTLRCAIVSWPGLSADRQPVVADLPPSYEKRSSRPGPIPTRVTWT